MLPDRVSNPGPLTYESGALAIALCGPATSRDCSDQTAPIVLVCDGRLSGESVER